MREQLFALIVNIYVVLFRYANQVHIEVDLHWYCVTIRLTWLVPATKDLYLSLPASSHRMGNNGVTSGKGASALARSVLVDPFVRRF